MKRIRGEAGFTLVEICVSMALLLVALLFCHGFLGALHQVCGPSEHSHPAGEHPSHTQGDSSDHPAAHLGCSEYAAVLISVLFGAIIALLLSGVRAWRKLHDSPRLLKRFLPPLILHLPRGPTAPVLQVFRL